MKLSTFELLAELLYLASVTSVLATLVCDYRYRAFPWFSGYISALWVQMLTLFLLTGSNFWYYWIYIYSQSLITVLQLCVLCEVFRKVFRPHRTLPRYSVLTLTSCGVLAMTIGYGIWSMVNTRAVGESIYTFGREALDGATGIVTAVGFAFVALFSNFFGIPWRNRLYGIGLGMLVGTMADALFSFLPQTPAFYGARTLGWAGAGVIWQVYLARQDTPQLQVSRFEMELFEVAVRKDVSNVREFTTRRAI